eukprot:scaffold244_cov372-Pavlova_lutheri.AAC.11
MDKELTHLCNEVAEQVAEAKSRKGIEQEKARNGGKRARPLPRPNSSPDESKHRKNGCEECTSGDGNRTVVIHELQKILVAVLCSEECRDALDEWQLGDEAQRNHPFRHADLGSIDDRIHEHFVPRGQGTNMNIGLLAMQQEEEEVESRVKVGRDANCVQ